MPKENEKTEKTTTPHRTVEEWRDSLGTPAWLFAAAKAKYNWPVGAELSESEYKKAVQAAEREVIR